MPKPLAPPTAMVISLIGFIVSIVYTAEGVFSSMFPQSFNTGGTDFGFSLGVAFCTIFLVMFIASFVNITPTDDEIKSLK
ncbi:MAG: hypothetical protein ACOCZ6_03570 [Nanoarchaeota archaeon]